MSLDIDLFRRFILRDMVRNWVRTLITIAGIALGVSVLLAINIANASALSKFKETVDLVSGKANLEIRPIAGSYMSEETLRNLRWLWTVEAKFSPVIDANAVMPGNDESGQSELVQFLGIDMDL